MGEDSVFGIEENTDIFSAIGNFCNQVPTKTAVCSVCLGGDTVVPSFVSLYGSENIDKLSLQSVIKSFEKNIGPHKLKKFSYT